MAYDTFMWSGLINVPHQPMGDKESLALTIRNTEDPDSLVRYLINKLEIRPYATIGYTLGNPIGALALKTFSGGQWTNEIPAEVVCLNDPTATLPSQVKIGGGGTIPGDSTLLARRFPAPLDIGTAANINAPSIPAAPVRPYNYIFTNPARQQGGLFLNGGKTVAPTLVVIPAGYGVAVSFADEWWFTTNSYGPYGFRIRALLLDTTNGDTYSVNVEIAPCQCTSAAIFSIFNGTGSGVSLTLVDVAMEIRANENTAPPNNGSTDNDQPGETSDQITRIEFFDRQIGDGETIVPDVAVPGTAVPGTLKISRNNFDDELAVEANLPTQWYQYGTATERAVGYAMRYQMNLVRKLGSRSRRHIGYDTTFEPTCMYGETNFGVDAWKYGDCEPISLRNGQGIAIYFGLSNCPQTCYVDLVITKVTDAGGGGGGAATPVARAFA